VHEKTKLSVKVMIWFGVCDKSLTVPIILDNGTLDAQKYIKNVLPIAPRGNSRDFSCEVLEVF
jgi:hypothetical protein